MKKIICLIMAEKENFMKRKHLIALFVIPFFLGACSKNFKNVEQNNSNENSITQEESVQSEDVIETSVSGEMEEETVEERNKVVLTGEENTFDVSTVNVNDIIPPPDRNNITQSTAKGLLTPLPFTKVYLEPNEESLVIDYALSIEAAEEYTLSSDNPDFYMVTFPDMETHGKIKGYINAKDVLLDCKYAFTIDDAVVTNENGEATEEILPAHTLVAWQEDKDDVSVIYKFDDKSMEQIFIKKDNLCDDYYDCKTIYKYNYLKVLKEIEDPLLYNLYKETVCWRLFETSPAVRESSTGLVRKEFKTLVAISDQPYKYVKEDWFLSDNKNLKEDIEKLEAYKQSHSNNKYYWEWGIFDKPALRQSCYGPMTNIGTTIIPAGTPVLKYYLQYLYVDPITREVVTTENFTSEQEPSFGPHYKESMIKFNELITGQHTLEESKAIARELIDADLENDEYKVTSFSRLVYKYLEKNYGTDFSKDISDILEFPGKLIVKSNASEVYVYDRPGTIGNIIGKIEKNTEVVPKKMAPHWYTWSEDGSFEIMFFYIETEAVSGWVKASELYSEEQIMYTSTYYGGNPLYLNEKQQTGPEVPTESYHYPRFRMAKESMDQDTDSFSKPFEVPYGALFSDGFGDEATRAFNLNFNYVIIDSLYCNPTVTGYSNMNFTGETTEIPDLIPVLVEGICIHKEEGYKEVMLSRDAIKVNYDGKSLWIHPEECYTTEDPY